jgi:hypothetical protein
MNQTHSQLRFLVDWVYREPYAVIAGRWCTNLIHNLDFLFIGSREPYLVIAGPPFIAIPTRFHSSITVTRHCTGYSSYCRCVGLSTHSATCEWQRLSTVFCRTDREENKKRVWLWWLSPFLLSPPFSPGGASNVSHPKRRVLTLSRLSFVYLLLKTLSIPPPIRRRYRQRANEL